MLERLRRAGVDDEADVGAVDAHAERDGRDHDVGLFVQERVLIAVALAVVEPGVIRNRANAAVRQPGRERVDLAPRRQ